MLSLAFLIGFGVQVDGFRVVVAASLQNIYLRLSRPTGEP